MARHRALTRLAGTDNYYLSHNSPARLMPRSFALGDRFDRFIDTQVGTGRYNNASQVVRDALRLLEDRDQLRDLRLADLRRLVSDGESSGLAETDGDATLDRLESKYRTLAPLDRR